MSTKEFNELQKRAIEKYKWEESERAGRDLGEFAVLKWIRLYAKKFREEYYEK